MAQTKYEPMWTPRVLLFALVWGLVVGMILPLLILELLGLNGGCLSLIAVIVCPWFILPRLTTVMVRRSGWFRRWRDWTFRKNERKHLA